MTNKREAIIFDLDGTLADITHRLKYIQPKVGLEFVSKTGFKSRVVEILLSSKAMVKPLGNKLGGHVLSFKQIGFKADWDNFHKACVNDKPIQPMIDIYQMLDAGAEKLGTTEFLILTGRSEAVRVETMDWLLDQGINYNQLIMRPEKNYTADHELKEQWLHKLQETHQILTVFDDRRKVVDMWRKNGLHCNHVAPGEF